MLLRVAAFVAIASLAAPLSMMKPPGSLQSSAQWARTAGEDASRNFALSFGWGAAVDTDLRFSEFAGRDHTLAARFMIQYERSYEGPILASSGAGGYVVSVAGYGEGRTGAEKLRVSFGERRRYYTVGGRLAPGRWHWLAVVREGSRLRLYLDGEALRADDSGTGFQATEGAPLPDATLRLGRRAEGDAQFYGFIDDVALFNSALSEKALKSHYQLSPRISGNEAGLIAAYTFDRNEAGAEGGRERPVSFVGPASKVQVSAARESRPDALLLPPPFQKTEVRLPFRSGQAWKVIQGYGQPLSHNGGGVFSFDFERVDGPPEEQPVYACAPGRVVALSDYNDPEPGDDISKDNFNYLQLEIGEGEVVTYLHMKNGSLTDALKGYGPLRERGAIALPSGALVGRVGNTWLKEQPRNWHLHFALVPYVNSPVSIPVAFSDYEVYDPERKAWRPVARGVPEQDQIVRRPAG